MGMPLWLLASGEQLEALAKVVREFYGPKAESRARAWRNLVAENASLDERDKLTEVNDFFNKMRFVDDIDVWGVVDYWATPIEFLGASAGDCDDYSISKYFTLLELGVDDSKMRLVYVNAVRYNQFHMVVAYYPSPSSVPLILDNINKRIRPATARSDLVPVYSFNGQHLWLMKEKGQGQLAGKSSRIKLWNDLQQRWRVNSLRVPVRQYDE
jgi:predicted transglutaminase-like cysteine proteinase